MDAKRESPIGTLSAALRQLESRPSEQPPSIVCQDEMAFDGLELADAAIEAAEQAAETEACRPAEAPTLAVGLGEFRADPAPKASGKEPACSDRLATLSIDRSYGRMWDSLTAAITQPLPWAIVAANADSEQDASWLLPMAVAFAQRHPGQILLVDASAKRRESKIGNTRRRGLSDQLGLECRFGLSDILHGAVDWRDAVEPTSVPRVGLLSGGQSVFLADTALKAGSAALITELKSSYQLLVIHATDVCDPLVAPLAAASDGALLALELGRTSRAVAETAASVLYLGGARLLGCLARG